MKKLQNNFLRVSALRIILLTAVLSSFGISLAIAAPGLGNYPDTSIPLSTDTTVTPDAAPTNTTRMTVSTSTSFDGTLEGNPLTGVVRVTDAHPAGTYTVTVKAFDAGGATATKTFALTVTTPATCASVAFAAATNLTVGTEPVSVAVGDFNSDSKQDLAVVNAASNNVSILLGDGAGNFSAPTNFGATTNPESVAVGDFNGDGKQDLAVGGSSGLGRVVILLGDGTGNFSLATTVDLQSESCFRTSELHSLVVGDFNGDGKQDVAAVGDQCYYGEHLGTGALWILLGDGTGNFTGGDIIRGGSDSGSFLVSVTVGDFNGDGNQDLAAAAENIGSVGGLVWIYLGDGTGRFSRSACCFIDGVRSSLAMGDFNEDGKQDLAVGNSDSTDIGRVSILFGNGDGSFSGPLNFGADSGSGSVGVGDFNGDGHQDLAVANFSSSDVSVLSGDGNGSFSGPFNFGVGIGPISVVVGDFNGDGLQDLAVANSSLATNSVSILLRDCVPPTLGNYPDTSVPLSADTTVIPDAAPTNTARMSVSTSTNFNGALEVDPATGVVRVTDAHPAGAYTVTVTAFTSSGVSATKIFTLTVATPVTCVPVSFAPAVNFDAGSYNKWVALGDFNGDGKQDLAVANTGSYPDSNGGVSILLGDGAGNFSGPTYFGVDGNPWSVTVGDFNGDGKQDLAVASYESAAPVYDGNVSILLGHGDGTFGGATILYANLIYSVAVGDFNGDGKQDLAVLNYFAGVSVLLGNGDGGFRGATTFDAGSGSISVTVGDFNDDGKLDLAIANINSYNVSILLGNGTGYFSAATNFDVGSPAWAVTVGDFNNDGKQDLAVAGFGQLSVSIVLGNGDGTFQPAAKFGTSSGSESVAVGDFNGDGNQDVADVGRFSSSVEILLGDGAGNFDTPTYFDSGGASYCVAVGDFNGDGKQDLAAAGTGDNSTNVSILLRDCPAPPIQITLKTNPAGRSFTVDGVTYNSTQRFSWVPGSSHTIATTSPQSGGTGVQYVWTKWSDRGAISHTVAPTSNTTYTATFKTQYFLTMTRGTGGRVNPKSGWKNSGSPVSITATPSTGFSFSNWTGTGTGSYSGPSNPASITMDGPITENATFIHN